MGLIGWIVFGAIAGWLASKINKTSDQRGLIGTIVLGIVGALVGGFLWNLIRGGSDKAIEFNVSSLVIAVIGALVVSAAYSFFTGKRGA